MGVMPDEGYRIKLSDEELHAWIEWRNIARRAVEERQTCQRRIIR